MGLILFSRKLAEIAKKKKKKERHTQKKGRKTEKKKKAKILFSRIFSSSLSSLFSRIRVSWESELSRYILIIRTNPEIIDPRKIEKKGEKETDRQTDVEKKKKRSPFIIINAPPEKCYLGFFSLLH